ncbi:hypothetical protein [Caulobacter phage KcrB]|nr:hypothetical protein RW_GP018 [Caulobacter phage RW]WCA46322.1 hypothetical protein [Caulobacter phage KcrB]WCD56257.1 hypothetical protein [Caulobacter phage RLK]WNV48049.1 hypothetical protein GB2A_gp017 [Caulobacter phage GB2A]
MADPRISISAEEHAKLIRLSAQHGPIATTFGDPRGTALSRNREGKIESTWALRYLAEWRGVTVSGGAGI